MARVNVRFFGRGGLGLGVALSISFVALLAGETSLVLNRSSSSHTRKTQSIHFPPPHRIFRPMAPVFTNDAVVLGILLAVLALVFVAERRFPRVFAIVPALLLCYFVPALLNEPLGLIAPHWYTAEGISALAEAGLSFPNNTSYASIQEAIREAGLQVADFESFERGSALYAVASRYLLPAALILLCLSIDMKAVISLGPKALIMFFAATLGIILGGPVALLAAMNFFPGAFNVTPDELWRGLSTIAGSWIGGGANQTAMKEIYEVPDSLFASMVVVDVIVANIWMACLLYGAGQAERIDRWLKADSSQIEALQQRVAAHQASVARIPGTYDLLMLLAVTFGGVALSHAFADWITPWLTSFGDTLEAWNLTAVNSTFFWIVVIATTYGLAISFTSWRGLEGVGASRFGSIFIYVLVATIGMNMDVLEAFANPGLFAIGFIWMLIHVAVIITVAKLIRAPFFFVAVGSQANVGGAASAPVVASAFSPSLAPVGVLLAVLGYAVGTYGGIVAAVLMRGIVGG